MESEQPWSANAEKHRALLESIAARMESKEPVRWNAELTFEDHLEGFEKRAALLTFVAVTCWTLEKEGAEG